VPALAVDRVDTGPSANRAVGSRPVLVPSSAVGVCLQGWVERAVIGSRHMTCIGETEWDGHVAEMSGRLSEVTLELRTSVSIVRGFAEHYRQRGKPLSAAYDPMMRRAADEVTQIETLVARLDVGPSHTPPGQANAADPPADAERDVP
jgi:hypothetical protein